MYHPLASEARLTTVPAMNRIGLHRLLVLAMLTAQAFHVSAGAAETAVMLSAEAPPAQTVA